ncbi:hypothetical protein BUALT_Bualt19G0108400 [Buddleja alternifolia]|uniref:Diacylglycerol O-acyltransferase n=1 Tax=Buddleja alternifolia TaxID=168488 RepID=A0AAV6W361_9LAMI|nr:hypothetical protein BUALT_Bualt19G0108400 [Buddleja alternifolia]
MADTAERDEPLTPAGRLFLQPQLDQVINCAIAVEHGVDADAIKAEIRSSIMLKNPRFCSLMVRDSCGREHWRKTQVDVDRHVILRRDSLSDDPSISDEDAVNDYIADLSVSSPLPTDKPLWEVHLLMARKTALFRVHHALGDGISLMSMLLSCCSRGDDPSEKPTAGGVGAAAAPRRRWSVWMLVRLIWYSLVYLLGFVLRAFWLRDETTAVSGGAGVELWPRRLATARFRLDDMKIVKGAVAHATINDVLFGILSCGLSRYLDVRSPKALPEGLQITGVAMVNLRPQAGLQDISKLMDSKSGTRWGNQFGMLLLPIYYHRGGSDPIEFVKRAKAMIDKKKLSLEAPLSYKIGKVVMSLFGAKAITMHMVSYAGMANMQILAAKEIIPDPKVLAKCFEDALLEMKEAAEINAKS